MAVYNGAVMSRRQLLAAAALPGAVAAQAPARPTLFELRRYRTRPGRRDELVTMFEDHFLDAYERAGARIVATWRDLDAADRWVWIRAFESAATRQAALAGFYGSPTWQARAEACNATLAEVSDARALAVAAGDPLAEAAPSSRSLIEARVCRLKAGDAARVAEFHAAQVTPVLAALGAEPVATLVTPAEPPPDPRRTLLAGHWMVVLSRFDSAAAHARHRRALAASAVAREAEHALAERVRGTVAVWRLQPTPRSRLR